MEAKNDMSGGWTRKDAWLGLLFLLTGALVLLLDVLLWRSGWDGVFLVPGFLIGLVLALLGGNAVLRAFRAGPGRS